MSFGSAGASSSMSVVDVPSSSSSSAAAATATPADTIKRIFELLSAVLFSRDRIAVHTGSNGSGDKIFGTLMIVEEDCAPVFVWAPQNIMEAAAQCQRPPSQITQEMWYSVCFPLAQIRSLYRYFPATGTSNLTVTCTSGESFKFYFHAGGLYELLSFLRKTTQLARSKEDRNMFTLQGSLSDALEKSLQTMNLESYSTDVYESKKNLSWTLLDWGSSITKHARTVRDAVVEKTKKLFKAPGVGGPGADADPAESFEIIHNPGSFQDMMETEPLLVTCQRAEEVNTARWRSFFHYGKIRDPAAVRQEIFHGGLTYNIRKDAWKYLLNYFPWDSTEAQRTSIQRAKREEYEVYKRQWTSITPAQEANFSKYRERKARVEKDVVRTDRSTTFFENDDDPNLKMLHDILVTYSFYNFDIGYCQGMSDLLSPILVVMEDEADAFWCFAGLMEHTYRNFLRDGKGIHTQLMQVVNLCKILDRELYNYLDTHNASNFFFAFRWIIVQFKREFDFVAIMRLWEVMWTHEPTYHFHVFAALAVLLKQRSLIMAKGMEFDEILQHMNKLSGTLDAEEVVMIAEALWKRFEIVVDGELDMDVVNAPDFSFAPEDITAALKSVRQQAAKLEAEIAAAEMMDSTANRSVAETDAFFSDLAAARQAPSGQTLLIDDLHPAVHSPVGGSGSSNGRSPQGGALTSTVRDGHF